MKERTLVVLKPDAVKRGIMGRVLSRFEDAGFKVVGAKMVHVDRSLAEKHYTSADTQIIGMGNKTLSATGEERAQQKFGTADPKKIGLQLIEWMRDFIREIPVVALVLEGDKAIEQVRKIVGFTDPTKAEPGTIRGDLGEDSLARANEEGRAVANLVHASGTKEEAEMEIKLWFSSQELFHYASQKNASQKIDHEVHVF